jgi:hypothetical protein
MAITMRIPTSASLTRKAESGLSTSAKPPSSKISFAPGAKAVSAPRSATRPPGTQMSAFGQRGINSTNRGWK